MHKKYLDESPRKKIKIGDIEMPYSQNVQAGAVSGIELQSLENIVLDIR